MGENPKIKVLLLHGGPAFTHEYLEVFDSYFPGAGIEYYYYDQLGSAYSDQPDEPELWEIRRFVDEVEQVRKALSLDKNNFYLFGHSWGGVLAIEYALAASGSSGWPGDFQHDVQRSRLYNRLCQERADAPAWIRRHWRRSSG